MTKRNLSQFCLLLCPVIAAGYLAHSWNQKRSAEQSSTAAPVAAAKAEAAIPAEPQLSFVGAEAAGEVSAIPIASAALADIPAAETSPAPDAVEEAPVPPPAPELPPLPPHSRGHIVMLCAGDAFFLRGEVASESLRERLREKAVAAFPGLKPNVDIRLNDQCAQPEDGIDLTLRSFPTAPSGKAPGMIAVALVGEHWRHSYIPSSGLAAGDLPKLGLFPAEFDFRRALAECEQVLPILKAHLESLALPTTVLTR